MAGTKRRPALSARRPARCQVGNGSSDFKTQVKECLDKIDSLLAQFKTDKSRLLSGASGRRPPRTGCVAVRCALIHRSRSYGFFPVVMLQ